MKQVVWKYEAPLKYYKVIIIISLIQWVVRKVHT